VKERILKTLCELRTYSIEKNYEIALLYHEEDSYLMRFANSSISLNTNEHLIRLHITAYEGKKRASFELITDFDKVDEMKQGIDTAAEMAKHAIPLIYKSTIPLYAETFADESGYDKTLATLSNEERLAHFNAIVGDLETDNLKLSGIFSSGMNVLAMINTRSEHTLYFKTSDAQITAVLVHADEKWEIIAEQSAHKKADLDADALNRELTFLVKCFKADAHQQLDTGIYDIVFGSSAIADMIHLMNWIGFNGGSMKRGFSFISEDKIEEKVFSDKVTLEDNPTLLETFPFKRDFTGMERKPSSFLEKGVFKGFAWFQDDADEFRVKPSGHTVMHKSLHLQPGNVKAATLEELVKMPREKDVLYIPFLHYMNIVNSSKGIITASSRFGALLLKADGSVVVPFNVRLTQSLLDVFGEKVTWLSKDTTTYNVSLSYGSRNPTAYVVPCFMQVSNLKISHSNLSF
jgi:predicted Zn-dependent protease